EWRALLLLCLRSATGTEHRLCKMLRDALPVSGKLRMRRLPIARAQRECEASATGLVFGQLVGLLVIPLLQAILDHAQIAIRRPERGDRFALQEALPDEQRQHAAQLATLQSTVAAAANQLESLHDEFDLANAAGTELDVVLQLAPLHFARDHALHLAQG